MYATIRRYEYEGMTTADELVRIGREIVAHLDYAQRFVSLLFLRRCSL